jgi:hypothetical protein
MKRGTRLVVLFFSFVAILIVFASCSTAPAQLGGDDTVISVESITIDQVKSDFGKINNPFIPPKGAITGKPYDFVVVRLTVRSDSSVRCKLVDAKVTTSDGGSPAVYFDEKRLADFWTAYQINNEEKQEMRNILSWYYMPASEFKAKGKPQILVFAGKPPILGPLTVKITLSVGSVERTVETEAYAF